MRHSTPSRPIHDAELGRGWHGKRRRKGGRTAQYVNILRPAAVRPFPLLTSGLVVCIQVFWVSSLNIRFIRVGIITTSQQDFIYHYRSGSHSAPFLSSPPPLRLRRSQLATMTKLSLRERLRRFRNRLLGREDPPAPVVTPPAPAPPEPPLFFSPTAPHRSTQPVLQLTSRQATRYFPPSRLQENLRGRAPPRPKPAMSLAPIPQSGTSATMQPLPGCLAAMSSAKTTPVSVPSAPSETAHRARQQQKQEQQQQVSPPSSSPSSSAKSRISSIKGSILSFRSNRSRGRNRRLEISHLTCQSAPSLGGGSGQSGLNGHGGLNGQNRQNGQTEHNGQSIRNGQSQQNGQNGANGQCNENGQSSSTPSSTTPSK
jgi:hypothetical protein